MTVHYKKSFGVALIALVGLAVFVGAIKRPTLTRPVASATTNSIQGKAAQSTKQQGVSSQTKQSSKTVMLKTVINQPIINHPTNLTAYLSTKQSGIIGILNGNILDNPADNIFTVSLDYQPETNDRIWLSYKLSGLDDQSNVTCSVNDRLAFGGYLLKVNSDTTRQRVQLSSSWLKKGFNRFQFSTPENPDYGYQISDLVIEVEKGANSSPLAVNEGKTSYDGKAYIHGFIQDTHSKAAEVSVDGHPVVLRDDEFEAIVDLEGKQTVDVVAQIDGKEYRRAVSYNHQAKPDKTFALNSKVEKNVKTFSVGKADSLQTADAQLKVDAKALISTTKLSLTSLRDIDIPAMDMALTNVTDGHQGFRFLPHGEHFTDGATVSLKYDRTKIPDGYTENDIKTFYFDSNTNHWVAMERDTINKDLCMVVSKTTHFTDMINGVIKVPESPETQGFSPTMMNDIKIADPTSKIVLISPPSANNNGTANLTYNIELPPARNGMSPDLSIQYNSDGGSGILGEGWDLNIPGLSIDTRWGVPRYSDTLETETYVLGGTMLAAVINTPSSSDDCLPVSVAHREVQYKRVSNLQFNQKVEGEFSRIIRKGSSPTDYFWEVTDKQGKIYTYGMSHDSRLEGSFKFVKGAEKNVAAEWKLDRVTDRHDDKIEYFYDKIPETIGNGITANAIYLKRIALKGFKDNYQTLEFKYDSIKTRRNNSARYGFLTSNNRLLTQIVVIFRTDTLKTYSFKYRKGKWGTDLLNEIVQLDNHGNKIATHTFEYNKDVSSEDSLFSKESQTINFNQSLYSDKVPGFNSISPLGGGESVTDGSSFYIGLGYNDGNWFNTSNTIGYNTSGSDSKSCRISTLVDINGDGLTDRVYKKDDKLYYRPNLGNLVFGNEIALINAPSNFSTTKSSTVSEGWKGEALVFQIGTDGSSTFSRTQTYFSDVNNDGLLDIIDNGVVWFNKLQNQDGIIVPAFTKHSKETSNPIFNIKTSTESADVVESEPPVEREQSYINQEKSKMFKVCPMQDIVRVWEAPFSGTVKIDGFAYFCPQSSTNNELLYNNKDGVYITIETNEEFLKIKTTDNTYNYQLKVTDQYTTWPRRTYVDNFNVIKGQRIFFRVKSGMEEYSNDYFDKILWSPFVEYISEESRDENNLLIGKYYSANDSRLVSFEHLGSLISKIGYNKIDSGITNLSVNCNFYFDSSNQYAVLTDNVKLDVHLLNDSVKILNDTVEWYDEELDSVLYKIEQRVTKNEQFQDRLVGQCTLLTNGGMTGSQTFPVNNDFGGKYFKFELTSGSNIRWDLIHCNPEIHYQRSDLIDTIVYAGVKHNTYQQIGTKYDKKFTPISGKGINFIIPQIYDIESLREALRTPAYYSNGVYIASHFRDCQFRLVVKAWPGGNGESYKIVANKTLNIIDGELQVPQIDLEPYTSKAVVNSLYNAHLYDPSIAALKFENFRYGAIPRFCIEIYTEDECLVDYLKSPQLNNKIMVKCITIDDTGNDCVCTTNIKDIPAFSTRKNFDFGSMWRCWGQFEYNNTLDKYQYPIQENTLYTPKNEEDLKLDNLGLVCMHPNILKKDSWVGLNENIYTKGDTISVARLNAVSMLDLNSALSTNGFVTLRSATEPNLDDLDQILNAPILSNTSDCRTYWGGASLSLGIINGVNGSKSSGGTTTNMGYMDMNGDGYPDRITDNKIEYSSLRGGRDGEITDIVPEKTTNSSYMIGSSAPIKSKSLTSVRSFFKQDQSTAFAENMCKITASISVSASKNENEDHSTNMYCDVNGDGLPDRLFSENGLIKVCYNLGYRFANAVTLSIQHTQGGKTRANPGVGLSLGLVDNLLTSALGVGLGINLNVQGSSTTSLALSTFRDINGDGLADAIYGSGSFGNETYYVAYNLGDRFGLPIKLMGFSGIQKSETHNMSMDGSLTLGIGYLFVKAVTSLGLSKTNCVDGVEMDLQDIDGDGYPDLLKSSSSSSLMVTKSKIGCTNKLISVQNSLGGKFTIQYNRSKATIDHPSGKWVMNSTALYDGISDDGGYVKTDFEYDGGKYDRFEREFLGFSKVVTKNIDTEKIGNETYRSILQEYDTRNCYVKGRTLSTIVTDKNGQKFNSNQNEYYSYLVSKNRNGIYVMQSNEPSTTSIVYAPVKYTKSVLYVGLTDSMIMAETFSEYHVANGNHGELSKYLYSDKGALGNDGTGPYNYSTEIEYMSNTSRNIFGLPKNVKVKGYDNKLYREINAGWDTDFPNHLCDFKQKMDDGTEATTNTVYNPRGNIISKMFPANAKGERMKYFYSYDDVVDIYVTNIRDTCGYSSQFTYDYRFGTPLTSTDINGNITKTTIDDIGRIKTITGPNEVASGKPYTLKFEYQPQVTVASGNITSPAFAVTKHFDETHPNNDMETVSFCDGFGRPIQVNKDAFINGGEATIISGRVMYDAFGRSIETYFPTIGANPGNKLVFHPAFEDSVPPTLTAYDVLDRVISVKQPDGHVTSTSYSIDDKMQKTIVTDPLNHSQATFVNGSGLTVKTEQYSGPDGVITTLFGYDDINQLSTVTDTKGGITRSEYDMAGHRTKVSHPASGTTTYHYDLSGNLISRNTANKDSIKYTYDFNRLVGIGYPRHKESDVTYVYGTSSELGLSNFNRAGRLVCQIDGSGAQEFKYGRMGEVTEARRTLVIPNHGVASFKTNWTYDSWNRLQTMTYPDGEKLTYWYNSGGQLNKLTGNKGTETVYVNDIQYDKFEQRSKVIYGNGTENNYTYNPTMRNLTNLVVKKTNSTLMNNSYTYDDVYNVTDIMSTANWPTSGTNYQMKHHYSYDNLYRLTSATGTFTDMSGNNRKSANYSLDMSYDNLHNIEHKEQKVDKTNIQFTGLLKAGYDLNYAYEGNPQQISSISDSSYRTTDAVTKVGKTQNYSYDANGNLLFVNTVQNDSKGTSIVNNQRKLLWDEENRLLAVSENGYVSNYWYDAAGERTVKSSGEGEGVIINGMLSGGNTGTKNYTAYVSPYTVVSNGGQISEHFYIGSQRIVSKIINSGNFAVSPLTDTLEANYFRGRLPFDSKYTDLTSKVKVRYDSLGVLYKGIEHKMEFFASTTPSSANLKYFYHPDHLGSSSLITDADGNLTQHVEYVPFGEVFLEEHNSWNTPYKFNAKELDEETGLYYYGARYYDPRTSVWLSVDPLAEKHPEVSSYVYCMENPIKFIDPDGRDFDIYFTTIDKKGNEVQKHWVFNGRNQKDAPDNPFVNKFLSAYNYDVSNGKEAKNGGGDNLKNAAENHDVKLKVAETKEHSRKSVVSIDGKTSSSAIVFWNPNEGLKTNENFIMSPATILEHEVDHALKYEISTDVGYTLVKDNVYVWKEERRVIRGSESKTAYANKEFPANYMRKKWDGTFVNTVSPTSNKVRK